ncbi:hypothetical protein INT48_003444 [Thamnidium elegans]|uniref:Swiss Army Knife RNA repair protein HAD domain-containing protein n=1 Tax=Thamnidium elegans TaxID=101142 RepID=A0A8H7VU46_9FUNG|nr:hypothetical protein INT48_003444 [Thamnidium elegans]
MSDEPVLEEFPIEMMEDIDHVAKEWIQQQSDKEVKRIRDVGSSVLPLKISNCGIITNFDNKRARAINRVELDTNCDLSKVQQIMVSPPIPYPHKAHFNYVNLILVTSQPIPFLAPYLYQTNLKVTQPEKEEQGRKYASKEITLKNDLRDYLLINKKGGVLQRQFEKSPFAQSHPTSKPKKLAIFDFDSTLFFSPLLSPTIWHPDLLKLATAESVYGPGWWRDIRSLDLGPFEELKKTAWEGYWNEKIVQDARDCIADTNTMTVVLTGRRFHPFHQLIPDMLESKGLQFDLIGLRPDPESVSDNQWEATRNKTQLSYNITGSVFQSTMHFKTCFILNLLHNIPSLDNVVMWDDRYHHVKRFKEYLDTVKESGTISEGKVIYVPGIRPEYNPEWQKRVIGHIIETHNKALLEHVKEGKVTGKCQQRLEWIENRGKPEDPLDAGSSNLLQLKSLPAQTVIALSTQSINSLKESYAPIFQSQMEKNKKKEWKYFGGEEPVFFGDNVYISQKVMPKESIPFGIIGTKLNDIKVTAYSDSPKLPCLLLQVQVGDNTDSKYILPLWYKPSEFIEIFRFKDIHWKSIKQDGSSSLVSSVNGEINYAYRLGVLETSLGKRTRDDTTPPRRSIRHKR